MRIIVSSCSTWRFTDPLTALTEDKIMATALTGPLSSSEGDYEWQTESYMKQIAEEVWPRRGKHILAQYDDHSVVVYQAFCPEIAEYATKHQK